MAPSTRPPIPLRRGPSLDDLLSEWKQLEVNPGIQDGSNSNTGYDLSGFNSLQGQESGSACLNPNSNSGSAVQQSRLSDSGVSYGHATGKDTSTPFERSSFDLGKTSFEHDVKPQLDKTESQWREGETSSPTPKDTNKTNEQNGNANEPPKISSAPNGSAEGSTEEKKNLSKEDDKKARRMLSNRESARRSRQRKQQHVDDLQGQASQLRAENLNILHRLAMVAQLTENLNNENRRLSGEVSSLAAQLAGYTQPPNPPLVQHPMSQPYALNPSPLFLGSLQMPGLAAQDM